MKALESPVPFLKIHSKNISRRKIKNDLFFMGWSLSTYEGEERSDVSCSKFIYPWPFLGHLPPPPVLASAERKMNCHFLCARIWANQEKMHSHCASWLAGHPGFCCFSITVLADFKWFFPVCAAQTSCLLPYISPALGGVPHYLFWPPSASNRLLSTSALITLPCENSLVFVLWYFWLKSQPGDI